MVEFSGGKIKPRRSSKPFEHIEIYILLKGQLQDLFSSEQGKQKSPIKITQPSYAKNVKYNLLQPRHWANFESRNLLLNIS